MLLSTVRQGIELISSFATQVTDAINKTSQIELIVDPETGFPEATFGRLSKDFSITKLAENYIREAWVVEGETIQNESLFRLWNSFTRAATHVEEIEVEKRYALQGVAGNILNYTARKNYAWN